MTDETQCPGNLESTPIGHLHQLLTLECETVMAAGRTDLVGTLAASEQLSPPYAQTLRSRKEIRSQTKWSTLWRQSRRMRTAREQRMPQRGWTQSCTPCGRPPHTSIARATVDSALRIYRRIRRIRLRPGRCQTSASLNGKASTNAEPASLPGRVANLRRGISSIIRRSTLPGPGGEWSFGHPISHSC